MLLLYDSLTHDEKANRIIRRFVSDRILEIIQFELDIYEFGMLDDLEKYSPDDDSLYYAITEDISPDNVSIQDANEAFQFLVRLLRSDQELDPSMLQSYQMFQLIAGYCDIAEDTGLETVERFPEKDRKIVLKALEPIAEEAECSVEEVIENYEDLHNYETICFEDWDFMQLDNMSFEELKESDANEILGMIGENETLNMKAQILKFPDGLSRDDTDEHND